MKARTHVAEQPEPQTKVGDLVLRDGTRGVVTLAEIQRRPHADGKGDFGFVLVFTEEVA